MEEVESTYLARMSVSEVGLQVMVPRVGAMVMACFAQLSMG